MIDSQAETILTLPAAATTVPNRDSGRGVNPCTVWRWAMRGVRGIKLETLVIGGTRYTSKEALIRFFVATTAAANGESPASSVTQMDRSHAINSAERELSAAGI